MIFKRMSKLTKGERLAMRGHGTGVVNWLGIMLQNRYGVSKRGMYYEERGCGNYREICS